jgi:hypothetical protein
LTNEGFNQPAPNISISRHLTLRIADVRTYDQPMAAAVIYPRFAEPRLSEALDDFPAVLVHGPRQCGKTTLARTAFSVRP